MLTLMRPTHRRQHSTGPISVCFVIDSLSRAGTESQLLALLRGLDRNRVKPTLCLLNGHDALTQSLLPTDCEILNLGLKRLLSGQAIAAARQLRQFWKKHHTQIVQTYFLDSTYFAVPLARVSGMKHIIRVRNNVGYWLTTKHRMLGKAIGLGCTKTLTNSDAGMKGLIESEGLDAAKIQIISNGVDVDRFVVRRQPNLANAIVRIGMVGNLRPVKNVDGLIQAVRPFPNIQLEIAGEGDQRPALEQLIREQKMENRVKLYGSVTDIPAFLSQLDVAILPSHSESLSNAVLEYMASGRAIIATDVGANATLIRHQVDGLIVPPRHEQLLREAIGYLLQHPDEAKRMAQSARERVIQKYSRERMLEEFHEFYADLVRN